MGANEFLEKVDNVLFNRSNASALQCASAVDRGSGEDVPVLRYENGILNSQAAAWAAMIDSAVLSKLAELVEQVTDKRRQDIDSVALKQLKLQCKASDENVGNAFDLLMDRLGSQDAQVQHASFPAHQTTYSLVASIAGVGTSLA